MTDTNIAPNSTMTTIMVQALLLALAALAAFRGARLLAGRVRPQTPSTAAARGEGLASCIVALALLAASIQVYVLASTVYLIAVLSMLWALVRTVRGRSGWVERTTFLLGLALLVFQVWRMRCPVLTSACMSLN